MRVSREKERFEMEDVSSRRGDRKSYPPKIMTDPAAPLKHFQNACPCCGYETIDGRGNYEICKICWWEDDWQDNYDANIARGGPNSILSLTRARLNFLQHGIFQPTRADLFKRAIRPSVQRAHECDSRGRVHAGRKTRYHGKFGCDRRSKVWQAAYSIR
jgi:Cysteine-rich CPCC